METPFMETTTYILPRCSRNARVPAAAGAARCYSRCMLLPIDRRRRGRKEPLPPHKSGGADQREQGRRSGEDTPSYWRATKLGEAWRAAWWGEQRHEKFWQP